MTKENTKSLLENIKKKMMKINAPKDSSDQLSFGNLDNEFEYIASVKSDAKSADMNDKQESVKAKDIPAFKEEDKHDTPKKEELKEELAPKSENNEDLLEGVVDDLALDFGEKKEEPKLSDLSLAEDLKQDFSSQVKKKNVAAIDQSVADTIKKDLASITKNVSVDNIPDNSSQPSTTKEFGLDDIEDVGDEMDFDIETANNADNKQGLIATNAASDLPQVKEDALSAIDDDLNFDLSGDEEEVDIKPKNEDPEEDNHNIGDLEDLADDHEIKDLKKPNQEKINIDTVDPLTKELDLSSQAVEHDDLGKVSTKADIPFDHDNQEDIKLDINSNDFDLDGVKGSNYNFDSLAKHANKTSSHGDIRLDLETSHDELYSPSSDIGDKFNQIDLTGEDSNASYEQMVEKSSKNSLLSEETIAKTSNSIKKLMNNFDNNKLSLDKSLSSIHTMTVEQMMMTMLQPKLEEWLNNNLPPLVEKIIREEIAKIIPKN